MSDASATETFGPYRLVRSLGRGGMAETFVAERPMAGGAPLVTCLKRILPGLLDDPELAASFQTESHIAATLRHANVACLVDHGAVDGRHYLALELVDGVDLRALMRSARRTDEPIDLGFVAEIAFAILHALEFAHAVGRDGLTRGIIHRDISPSNVLLGRHGEVKLADFGIAKVTGASHHTRTGMLRGKIPYMPPEYVRGEEFTASGDLFALGVMLFECLAGVRPYDGGSDAETLDRLLRGDRRRLTDHREALPEAWLRAVDALLDPSPETRPAGARDVLALLQDVAPRATTRGRLARVVSELAPRHADDEGLPFDSTLRHPQGAPGDEPRQVVPAAADDPTRTRLPR